MNAYDFVVIGSGPAGRRAAIQAAKLGKSVLVIEKGRRVGGVSVHTGTIPSKTMRETVLNLTGWRERGFYGSAYRVKQDLEAKDLTSRLLMTLNHEVDVLEHQFARNGVKTMSGAARFVDTHRVEVTLATGDTCMVESARFLIAVGTRPYRPTNIPFNGTNVLDSDELIEDFLHQLRDRGMTIRMGSKVEKIEFSNGNPVVTLESGRQARPEMLLFAGGRVGATDTLGLEACGLTADARGHLKVDPATCQTEVPHIYAGGDVIGFPSLASTSMEQGRVAACHAFGIPMPPPPEHFPYGIYAVPEISTVGMSEEEVRQRGIHYECGIARFRETSRGHIMGLDQGLLKMIFSLKTRRLLGVHIVGEGATELIHIGQAVVNLKGTLDYFIENTFNYPTLAEAYKIAALDAWNRMPRAGTPEPVTAEASAT